MAARITGSASLYLRKGDLDRAIPVLERSLALCQVARYLRSGSPELPRPWGMRMPFRARLAEAIPLLEQAVEQAASMRFIANHSLWMAHLSEALSPGRPHAGGARPRPSGRWRTPVRTRNAATRYMSCASLANSIAARREPPESDQAEGYYRQALNLAQELGMRPLQAHCHHGLGTLYAHNRSAENTHVPSCSPPSRCTAPWT